MYIYIYFYVFVVFLKNRVGVGGGHALNCLSAGRTALYPTRPDVLWACGVGLRKRAGRRQALHMQMQTVRVPSLILPRLFWALSHRRMPGRRRPRRPLRRPTGGNLDGAFHNEVSCSGPCQTCNIAYFT